MATTQEYRARAAELRARAAGIRDPVIREGFIDLANEYDTLADNLAPWSLQKGPGTAPSDAELP
jgi:hypothetical protein